MSLKDVGTGNTMRPALRSFVKEWILVAALVPFVLRPDRVVDAVLAFTEFAGYAAGIQAEVWIIVRAIAFMLIAYTLLMSVAIPVIANRYQITGDRIIEVYGILKRDTNSTELAHIRRANAKVGVFARMMEICGFKPFGDLICYTAGSGDEDLTLKGILEPGKVEERMRELLKASQDEANAKHTGGPSSGNSGFEGKGGAGDIMRAIFSEREYRKELERRVAILEHQVGIAPRHTGTSDRPKQPKSKQPVTSRVDTPIPYDVEHGQANNEPEFPTYQSPSLIDDPIVEPDYAEPTPKMFGDGGELATQRERVESVGILTDK